jgi:hypothetical protein
VNESDGGMEEESKLHIGTELNELFIDCMRVCINYYRLSLGSWQAARSASQTVTCKTLAGRGMRIRLRTPAALNTKAALSKQV